MGLPFTLLEKTHRKPSMCDHSDFGVRRVHAQRVATLCAITQRRRESYEEKKRNRTKVLRLGIYTAKLIEISAGV